MKEKKNSIDIKLVLKQARHILALLKPYKYVGFFLLLALMYGFLILRINTLSNAPVDQNEVDAQIKASPSPHIDASAINQLHTLNDNSVNVQTLFQQGRTNPFQE